MTPKLKINNRHQQISRAPKRKFSEHCEKVFRPTSKRSKLEHFQRNLTYLKSVLPNGTMAEGTFGKMILCYDLRKSRLNSLNFVIKDKQEVIEQGEEAIKRFKTDVKLCKKIRQTPHPFIMKTTKMFQTERFCIKITNQCSRFNLKTFKQVRAFSRKKHFTNLNYYFLNTFFFQNKISETRSNSVRSWKRRHQTTLVTIGHGIGFLTQSRGLHFTVFGPSIFNCGSFGQHMHHGFVLCHSHGTQR